LLKSHRQNSTQFIQPQPQLLTNNAKQRVFFPKPPRCEKGVSSKSSGFDAQAGGDVVAEI